MKIKFVSPELAAFTGMYGSIEFLDGESIGHVTDSEVRLYSAITAIEVIGDDFTPEKSYDEVKNIFAVSANLPTLADLQRMEAEGQTPEPVAAVVAPSNLYTQAQLEAIADADGITGIRAIADPLDIKGTSITKMIAAIIASQAKFAPAAGFIDAPAEAVTLTITEPLVSPSDVVADAITEAASE